MTSLKFSVLPATFSQPSSRNKVYSQVTIVAPSSFGNPIQIATINT